MDRRNFIKTLGGGALAAVVAPLLPEDEPVWFPDAECLASQAKWDAFIEKRFKPSPNARVITVQTPWGPDPVVDETNMQVVAMIREMCPRSYRPAKS